MSLSPDFLSTLKPGDRLLVEFEVALPTTPYDVQADPYDPALNELAIVAPQTLGRVTSFLYPSQLSAAVRAAVVSPDDTWFTGRILPLDPPHADVLIPLITSVSTADMLRAYEGGGL